MTAPTERSYYSPGLVDEVAEEIQRQLRADPDNLQLRFTLANVLVRKGRPDEAMRELEVCLQKQATPELHNNLGKAAFAAGNYERAAQAFEAVLAAEKRWPDTLYHLAMVERSLGRHEPALQHLEEAVTINPRYREALYERACLLEEMGRANEALLEYKRVIALFFSEYQFDDVNAFRYDVTVLFSNPELVEESIRQLRRLTAKYPGFADAHHRLGLALQAKGLAQEAALSFRRALEINPRYDTARRSFWKRG